MAITRPQLPPKAGYVEVVDENGTHVYKRVITPEVKEQEDIRAILNALLGKEVETDE